MKRLLALYSGLSLVVFLVSLSSVGATTMTGGYFSSGSSSFDKPLLESGNEATGSNFNNNSYGISSLKLFFDDTYGIVEGDFSFRIGNSNDLSTWTTFNPSNVDLDLIPGTEATLSWSDPLINGWLEVAYSTGQYLYVGNLVGDANLDGYVTPIDALSVINHINDTGNTYSNQYDINGDGTNSPIDALIIINRLNSGDNGASLANGPFGSGNPTIRQLPDDDLFFPNLNLKYELDLSNTTYALTSTPVPEPSTVLLLVTGMVGLAGIGRKNLLCK